MNKCLYVGQNILQYCLVVNNKRFSKHYMINVRISPASTSSATQLNTWVARCIYNSQCYVERTQ